MAIFFIYIILCRSLPYVWVISFNINNQLTHIFMQYDTAGDESYIAEKHSLCMYSYLYHSPQAVRSYQVQNSKSAIFIKHFGLSERALTNIKGHQKYIHKKQCQSLCAYVTVHAFKVSTLNLLFATSADSISCTLGIDLIIHCIKWLTWCLNPEFCSF